LALFPPNFADEFVRSTLGLGYTNSLFIGVNRHFWLSWVDVHIGSMEADRLAVSSGGEHRSLQRCNSANKDAEVLSTSLSASVPSSVYRQLRQHRNSWPTIDVAATAAAKAIRRKYVAYQSQPTKISYYPAWRYCDPSCLFVCWFVRSLSRPHSCGKTNICWAHYLGNG